ncbi:MAG: hypothetical protein JWO85_580 [Candidatus Eremiobacteraeota bacterium]|nr:hypothetical protein [Candidatus Eremiobacteraeota bacterium]
MTDTPRESAPDILSIRPDVRRAIASGRRYVCTYTNGVMCLGRHSVAWCITKTCNAPRCEKHIIDGKCATCQMPVVTFETITSTVRAWDAANAAMSFVGGSVNAE